MTHLIVMVVLVFIAGGISVFAILAYCLSAISADASREEERLAAAGLLPPVAMSGADSGAPLGRGAPELLPIDPLGVVRWHPSGTLPGNAKQRRIARRNLLRRQKIGQA